MTGDGGIERIVPRSIAIALSISLVILGLAAIASRARSLDVAVIAHNDFTQDYVSAKASTDGTDPYRATLDLVGMYLPDVASSYRPVYEERTNAHPPSEIVLARAVAWMSYRSARVTWMILDALLFVAGLALAARSAGWSPTAGAVAGIGALALPIVQQDLIWGQMGGLLLLMLVLAARWTSDGRSAAPGVALGILSALKVYPLLLVIPMLRQKRWSVVGAQVATFTVVTGLASAAVGMDALRSYVSRAAPDNFEFWRAAPMNFSLTAIPFRWLTESPWHPDGINLPVIAWMLAIALGLACVARTAYRSSGSIIEQTPWIVLAAPLVWPFTLVLLLPFLFEQVRRIARPLGIADAVLLISIAAIVAAPLPGLPLPSSDVGLAALLAGYGLPTYAMIFVAIRAGHEAGRGSVMS